MSSLHASATNKDDLVTFTQILLGIILVVPIALYLVCKFFLSHWTCIGLCIC